MRCFASVSCLSLILFVGACGKAIAPSAQEDPMLIFASETAAKDAAVPTSTNPAPKNPENTTERDLQGLNLLVRDYVRVTRKIPKDVNELVSSGFVSNAMASTLERPSLLARWSSV